MLQDVASARTRVARQRRTACRHGHAPQHHRVPRHQGISCPTCMPNSFSRARPPPWNPSTLTHRCSPRPTRIAIGRRRRRPHSLPHVAGHRCHEPRWQQHPMDLLHGQVCTVHVSHEFLTLHRETHAHIRLVFVPPNTTAVCQPLDRAYMRPFKAALGRYLCTVQWSGNPKPSRRRCQLHPQPLLACAASSCAGPTTR